MSTDKTLKSPAHYIELAKHLCTDFTDEEVFQFDDDPEVRVDSDGKILVHAWIVLKP